jgi:hypothetical protein
LVYFRISHQSKTLSEVGMPLTKNKISFLTKKSQKHQEKQLTIHFDSVFVEKDIKNEFELFLEKPFELLFLIELKELEYTKQTKKNTRKSQRHL